MSCQAERSNKVLKSFHVTCLCFVLLLSQSIIGAVAESTAAFQQTTKNPTFFRSNPTSWNSPYQKCTRFRPVQTTTSTRDLTILSNGYSQNDDDLPSSSVEFALDPNSPVAQLLLEEHLGLSEDQYSQLKDLAELIVDWNERINLISRKDCNVDVVFGRHILPCLAPLVFDNDPDYDPVIQRVNNNDNQKQQQRVVDVGTGGGFPGLPLAIAYPNVEFLLVDSVGKKLGAVRDMAKTLGLRNVQIHHGRAEDIDEEFGKFDVCVGRSVAAIPRYCAWMQHLLKDDDGRLMYIIGGDIEQDLLDKTIIDVNIDELLAFPGSSDKRILVFPQKEVFQIATNSGELRRPGQSKKGSSLKRRRNTKKAKGSWTKRDSSLPKQRGYENFKRYNSNSSSAQ